MAREVFVSIGGVERRLMFGTREGIELKRRFNKTPKRLLNEDLAPSENGFPAWDFDPEVVCAALYLGLRHELRRKETEADVVNWFDAECKEGRAFPVINQIVDAMMLDGITGHSVDLEARRAAKAEGEDEPEAKEPPEPAEGKAVRPPDNP